MFKVPESKGSFYNVFSDLFYSFVEWSENMGSKCKHCSRAGDSLRLEDGQAVQLEDGTTAFIHHTSKGKIVLWIK